MGLGGNSLSGPNVISYLPNYTCISLLNNYYPISNSAKSTHLFKVKPNLPINHSIYLSIYPKASKITKSLKISHNDQITVTPQYLCYSFFDNKIDTYAILKSLIVFNFITGYYITI